MLSHNKGNNDKLSQSSKSSLSTSRIQPRWQQMKLLGKQCSNSQGSSTNWTNWKSCLRKKQILLLQNGEIKDSGNHHYRGNLWIPLSPKTQISSSISSKIPWKGNDREDYVLWSFKRHPNHKAKEQRLERCQTSWWNLEKFGMLRELTQPLMNH